MTIRRVKHIGRLGRYAEKAARSDMASIIFTCGGGHGINQAPFGGAEPKLSPIQSRCLSRPASRDRYVVDMATSVVAEGKVRMYRARGLKPHPGGSSTRTATRPRTPRTSTTGAPFLPLGQAEGHKGYALAFMVDLFGGVLSGGGIPGDPTDSFSNDSMMIVLDPHASRRWTY